MSKEKSIEEIFFSDGSLEEIEGLRVALKKLPERCFFHVSRDAKNRITKSVRGVHLDVYGHFIIPEGAKEKSRYRCCAFAYRISC